jgi:hypothetical protein
MKDSTAAKLGCTFQVILYATCIAAWATHIYVCFNENHWGFLIAGALFFPLAIIHGVGLWLGFWH